MLTTGWREYEKGNTFRCSLFLCEFVRCLPLQFKSDARHPLLSLQRSHHSEHRILNNSSLTTGSPKSKTHQHKSIAHSR